MLPLQPSCHGTTFNASLGYFVEAPAVTPWLRRCISPFVQVFLQGVTRMGSSRFSVTLYPSIGPGGGPGCNRHGNLGSVGPSQPQRGELHFWLCILSQSTRHLGKQAHCRPSLFPARPRTDVNTCHLPMHNPGLLFSG